MANQKEVKGVIWAVESVCYFEDESSHSACYFKEKKDAIKNMYHIIRLDMWNSDIDKSCLEVEESPNRVIARVRDYEQNLFFDYIVHKRNVY